MDATPEEWRPVVGYEGAYEISDRGRVRSMDRVRTDTWGRRTRYLGQLLKPRRSGPQGKYYLTVALTNGAHGKIHVLVAAAFIGPRPDGAQVCHNDGDRFNNQASNLRYATPSENNHDIVRHGRHVNACKTTCPQGHELKHPNLVNSELPYRKCRACNSGHAYVQRHPEADFATESERYYAQHRPCAN